VRYKTLGKTALSVSEVGLGTWAYGNDKFGHVDDNQSIAAIHAALDAGINLIDTAQPYGAGHSEEVVGHALAGHRDRALISTKCGTIGDKNGFHDDLTPNGIRTQLENSLRRLNVDVIDIYLFHWPDNASPLEASAETIARLKESGKIRHFGVSNFSIEQVDIIDAIVPVEVLQPHHSILFREREALIDACSARGIGVMAYGPLAGGMLTGKFKEKPTFTENDTRDNFYPFFKDPLWDKSKALVEELQALAGERNRPLVELAINYVAQDPRISTALVGAKTPAQVQANAAAADWAMTDDERRRIDEAYWRIFAK